MTQKAASPPACLCSYRMELYPSTSCLLWAQTILTQKRRPSARTSKGRHQTAAKRISHLRQVVKGSRVSPGEAADIAYLDALIGDEWKTAEALAGRSTERPCLHFEPPTTPVSKWGGGEKRLV